MNEKEVRKIIMEILLKEYYVSELEIISDEWDGMFNYVKFSDNNNDLGNSYLAYREKKYPNINNGDPVLELHIQVDEKLRGKGYALKMIKTFLAINGGVGWISFGRITNPLIHKLMDKLDDSDGFDVQKEEYGYLIYEF